MSAPAVLVVRARGGGEDVEHRLVDGGEHAVRKIFGALFELAPACGKVERDYADLSCVDLGMELLPVVRREAGPAIDLLDEKDMVGARILQQVEQFRSGEFCGAPVFYVDADDLKPAIGCERLEVGSCTVSVLIVGGGAEGGTNNRGEAFRSFQMVHRDVV